MSPLVFLSLFLLLIRSRKDFQECCWRLEGLSGCDFIDGNDSPVDVGHGRCLPTAPRHVDVGDDDSHDRSWWTGYRRRNQIVICRSNSGRIRSIRNGNDGTGHAQDPDCTQQRENGLDGQQWRWWCWWTMESFIKQRDRCQRHIIHQQQEIKEQMVWRPTLALLPV